MIDEFKGDGYWTDETFFDFYDRNATQLSDHEALVDSQYRVTWAQAKDLTNAIATAWASGGLPKDARVIIQSPNSVYGFLARIAAERAGLISLTVYPYLRQRELEYMMELTQASIVVIPHVYRKFDYLEMYKGFMQKFPSLKQVYLFDEQVPAAAPGRHQELGGHVPGVPGPDRPGAFGFTPPGHHRRRGPVDHHHWHHRHSQAGGVAHRLTGGAPPRGASTFGA